VGIHQLQQLILGSRPGYPIGVELGMGQFIAEFEHLLKMREGGFFMNLHSAQLPGQFLDGPGDVSLHSAEGLTIYFPMFKVA
jgi:hypothetical protein